METKEIETIVTQKLENPEEMEIEEIEEIIFVDQIEEGEIRRENFLESITKMGLPYTKKGRIAIEEVEETAEELCEFLKYSTNPQGDIKDLMKMKDKKGVDKINNKIKNSTKIRERDKAPVIERNNTIHNELKALSKKKVKVNNNLMWDLYTIKRGERRAERFEEEGQDIELLKVQNSFISNDMIDELKELRGYFYEEE